MKKVYLLITTALLLIGSGTMWAQCTADNAWAKVYNSSTYSFDFLCDQNSINDYISGELFKWYEPTDKYLSTDVTLSLYPNGDVEIPSLSERTGDIETADNEATVIIEPASGITGSVSFTNSLGVYYSSKWKVGTSFAAKSWNVALSVNNNGYLLFDKENATFQNLTINNSNTGNIAIVNGKFYNLSLNNSNETEGCIVVTGGSFSDAAYNSIQDYIADGYTTYKDGGMNVVINEANVVAQVGTKLYTSLSSALFDSSDETPAKLYKDVTLSSSLDLSSIRSTPHVLDMNGHNLSMKTYKIIVRTGVAFDIINSQKPTKGVISSSIGNSKSAIELIGSTLPEAENSTVLNIEEGVTLQLTNSLSGTNANYAVSVLSSGNTAYGVVVNINGTIKTRSGIGICINGKINRTDGNVPVININDGAKIVGYSTYTQKASIYAAGYGIWNIGAATLQANTPIYAKSGTINIDGATIQAKGAKAAPQPSNNGFYTTGDAIVMDTNKSYAGAVLLNIYGDATINSKNGYAIQEVITNGTTSSAAGIAITGENTLLEGKAGSVQMTADFEEAMIDGSSSTYEWILNGISGGVYSVLPTVVADGYVAQEVEISGKTYYKVVPAPEEPVAPATQTTYIINDTEWDYAVNLTNSSAIVVKTGATFSIKGIEVNRANLDDVSKVTVEPGAKLIVGSNGIQTNESNALVLQSDAEHGMGMLLYDGSTTATSPYGKAELYVSSKNLEGGDRIWQHFGIPTQSIPSIEKEVPASFNNWDVKKGWVWDGGSATLTEPWVGHNLSVNSDTPGQIITFGGQLVGNEDATLTLNKYGYNAFANSYTAPVNLKSIIDGALAIDACTDGAVWVYSAAKAISTGIAKFDSYGADTSEDAALDPMQAFFILHESSSADNIELSYNEAVLGQNTRGADASSYNKATFTVTANGEADDFKIYEGEQFSSTSIDRGYDIKQMNHGFIKIFAKQNGEDYASVATDDAEGVELYIETKQAGEYKLSFSNISEGYEISLTDIVTGTEVEVAEDKVYTFTVDENTTVKRFRFGKSQVSAEEANADAVKIWANDGAIFVANNAAEANIEIINLSGVVVATAAANGEAVQAVPVAGLASGVYVVRVGAATAKVVK